MAPTGSANEPDLADLDRALRRITSVVASEAEPKNKSLSDDLVELRRRMAIPQATQGVDPDLVHMVAADADQLSASLAAQPSANSIADELRRRLRRTAAALLMQLFTPATPAAVPNGLVTPERPPQLQREMNRVIALYKEDAEHERRSSRVHTACALILVLASIAAAAWAVQVAGDSTAQKVEVWPELVAPLLAVALLGAFAVQQLNTAGRAQRAAREYVRLQRGLSVLDSYLAPLPLAAQHLLRATMAQSFFPPLLEDDDPLRHTQWPDSQLISASVYEYVDDPTETDVATDLQSVNTTADPDGEVVSTGEP